MPAIKADSPVIQRYYAMLDEAARQGQTHEGNVRNAFQELLRQTAKDAKGWELITEETVRRETNAVRYDGTLRDSNRLPHGWWEAKDSGDDLDNEIRKKREKGYRFDNIIFEDTRRAVLYQDGLEVVRVDLRDPAKLTELLNRFYTHEIEPFKKFAEAVSYFQVEIPTIANGLKERIEAAHKDNRKFQTAFDAFMELCKNALNPNISQAAVDEMLIQHMLTIRLIAKIFTEGFTGRNVIATEIENVIGSLTSPYFNPNDFLGALDRFYTAIEEAAETLATFSEKQDFINHVYERFFQGYSVKIADTHGIVYTPQPIVDFMCAAVEEVLLTEFGKKLGDDGVYVIDPATGTGNFAVNLLRRAYATNPRGFEQFYRHQLFANEVMLMPYYIASLNIEHAYFELTGKYEPFDGICFVDTLDLAEGAQMKLSFMTERNTARVERQKKAPITVILGNPPYNANQQNENDNNKNRTYKVIDGRVRETYAAASAATNKNQLSDPYVKFFRWASDRLQGRDGVVCYISNNNFIDQIPFDGMRKHLLQDFTRVYHLDLHGNVRQNPRLSGTTHNVFGIQVGVGITVAVRSEKQTEHKLLYHRVPDFWTRYEKLIYLTENVDLDTKQNSLNTVQWEELLPDKRHNWLLLENADEFALLPSLTSLFSNNSPGLQTNRDDWAYNFSSHSLANNMRNMINTYNSEIDRWKRSSTPIDIDSFVTNDEKLIKWSSRLKETFERKQYANFDQIKIRESMYRPFSKKLVFFDNILNHRQGITPKSFPTVKAQEENLAICCTSHSQVPFSALVLNRISDVAVGGRPGQCFPFYTYDEDGTNRRENITDWALAQFRSHYATNPLRPEGEGLGMRVSDELGVRVENDAVYRAKAAEVMTTVARDLRQRQTPAEELVWEHLRNRRLGNFKFRRQNPLENTAYVVDFLCYEARLVVELDGGIHAQQAVDDAIRQENIEAQGYQVLRFTNEQLFNDLETVLTKILTIASARIQTLTLNPSPSGRGTSKDSGSDTLVSAGRGTSKDSGSNSLLPEGEGLGMRVITKWDIFYYVYALLHHPTYRTKFADNLKRELPRIPFVDSPRPEGEGLGVRVFWAFAEAGKKLADLHLNYETVKPYALDWVTTAGKPINYRVEKMKVISPRSDSLRPEGEGSGMRVSEGEGFAIVYNDTLTLKGIPKEAFDYKLGNRSALHWIVDQYQVSIDKRSGITSDPNTYSDDERYIVNLVERVTRVSVETVAIVNALPPLP